MQGTLDVRRYPNTISLYKRRRENHEVFSFVDETPLLTLDSQCTDELFPDWHFR
jgi:hypothetical protein